MLHALASLGQRLLRPRIEDPQTDVVPTTDRLNLLSAGNTDSPLGSTCDIPAAARTDPLQPFALSAEDAGTLVQLLRLSRRALDPDYQFQNPGRQGSPSKEFDAVKTFFEKRTRLVEAALAGDGLRTPTAPVGPGPDMARCTDAASLLKQLLKHNPGLVVGHAGMRLLADNMKLLRRLGVDTLYVDHLQADTHQATLDQMHCRAAMSSDVARFVEGLDAASMRERGSGNTYRALLDAAVMHGVRIVALDLATSHHLKGVAVPEGQHRLQRSDLRARVFSHVAGKRIRHIENVRTQLHPQRPPSRWIGLMDTAGAGTFNGNAGVARQLGVPSLRVQEVPTAKRAHFQAGYDPGHSEAGSALQDSAELQCDYLVQVGQYGVRPIPGGMPGPCTAPEATAARQLRAAIAGCADDLARIGTYRVIRVDPDEPGMGSHALVHRSGTGALIVQRIVAVRGGGLRLQLPDAVDAERWGHVARVFPHLDGLRQALSTQLEEVPATTTAPR